jgi:hypothetical protein
MKSIAIWYESNNIGNDISDAELHFNLWKIPQKQGKYNRFLDIGVKLERTDCIKKLNIFFPTYIDNGDISDVVDRFISDNALVCAIFNEDYKITSNPQSKFYSLSKLDNEFDFDVYKLEDSDITLKNNYGGTIVQICLPPNSRKTYVRIRICGKYCNGIGAIEKPSNAFIQSAFSKIEFIDFRVNDLRDLNYSLIEQIKRGVILTFNKVHFFFVCSSTEDLIGSHIPCINSRNLEQNKWQKYLNDNVQSIDNNMIAYHWKETGVSNFNVLLKSKYEKNDWKTILIYLLILFILTLLFNFTSSYLYEIINPK